jgi:C_GCAxxG_C_C family probable redox protein
MLSSTAEDVRMNDRFVEKKNYDDLIESIRKRARNIFSTHQLMCAEAVLTTINRGLGGDLSDDMAIRMASGFAEGLSGSGCLCGAVSGGVLALGVFLGRNSPGFTNRRKIAEKTGLLHDLFKKEYGTTCCRMLTKNVKEGSQAHLRQCAELTGAAAAMAARIILKEKPGLVLKADLVFLRRHDTKLSGRMRQAANILHFGR